MGGRHLGQEHRRQKADGYADDNGACGAVDGGENEGQNSVLGIGLIVRVPGGSKQEVHQAHLPNGREAGDDQIYGNNQHEGHGNEAAKEEQPVHSGLQRIDFLGALHCETAFPNIESTSRLSVYKPKHATNGRVFWSWFSGCLSYWTGGTAPAWAMRSATSALIANSRKAWATSLSSVPSLVIITKGRWMA